MSKDEVPSSVLLDVLVAIEEAADDLPEESAVGRPL